MKQKQFLQWAATLLCVLLALCFVSCSGEGGDPMDEEEQNTDITIKIAKAPHNRRIVMEAWGEPEEDPRQIMGYVLDNESETPFFDRYVILYGGRIDFRNCAGGNNRGEDCNKTGLHLHLGNAVKKYILDDATNKLRPLQARGIKVLMSLVPQGDGACIGNLFKWHGTGKDAWPAGTEYPFGEDASMKFVKQVADALREYGIDGVAYDEEYAAVSTGEGSDAEQYPGLTDPYAGASGENFFRFGYELNKEMNGGVFKANSVPQDLYEIRTAAGLPSEMEFDGKRIRFTQVFDYGFSETYGGWQAQSRNPFPTSRFGPASVAIADVDNAPRPPATPNGITSRMNDVLNGKYGIVMYYCFRSRDEVASRWPDKYGPGHPEQEYYFSMISDALFGCQTKYIGPDYPRMWYW